MNTDEQINAAAVTAMGLITAARNGDMETAAAVIAETTVGELVPLVWALVGASKHLLAAIAIDLGDEELDRAWQQAAADIAAAIT